jgi:hypothetical protein
MIRMEFSRLLAPCLCSGLLDMKILAYLMEDSLLGRLRGFLSKRVLQMKWQKQITRPLLSTKALSRVCHCTLSRLHLSELSRTGYEQIVSNSALDTSQDPNAELVLDARSRGR